MESTTDSTGKSITKTGKETDLNLLSSDGDISQSRFERRKTNLKRNESDTSATAMITKQPTHTSRHRYTEPNSCFTNGKPISKVPTAPKMATDSLHPQNRRCRAKMNFRAALGESYSLDFRLTKNTKADSKEVAYRTLRILNEEIAQGQEPENTLSRLEYSLKAWKGAPAHL